MASLTLSEVEKLLMTSPSFNSISKPGTPMEFIESAAYAPAVSQQKGAVSRREPRATGPGEFFTRSRTIGTTSINRANANAVSKSQKPHLTSRQSCGGYRVKKLGGSPSSWPRRRPAVALPLSSCSSASLHFSALTSLVRCLRRGSCWCRLRCRRRAGCCPG